LIDFEQDRKHRPDFLAYRENVWLLVAARVEPSKLEGTRQRLSQGPPPFKAKPVIVIPDEESFVPDDKYPPVEVVRLRELVKRDTGAWEDPNRPGWD
jgi:hypothetical protein